MNALIFAAGLGTRLKPLTDTLPKALVPIAGKPLLQWQIERLRAAGITNIVVNVHHFADKIIEAIQANEGWGCSVQVSDERDCLLETGGGLRKAKGLLLRSDDDQTPILACNVDILSNIDILALCAAYDPQTMGTLVVSQRQTQRYLLFDDQQTLRGWTNIATGELRPTSLRGQSSFQRLAFSGMQLLNPAIFDLLDKMAVEKGDKFSLIDLYLSICEANMNREQPSAVLKAFVPQDYRMMDVGKIDQIEEAERFAQGL